MDEVSHMAAASAVISGWSCGWHSPNERHDMKMPGPATPTSFREQCYQDREMMEKKRSRKSGAPRPDQLWRGKE